LTPIRTVLILAAACTIEAQEIPVKACAVLTARDGGSDTARIQTALDLCSPGKAVVLRGDGAKTSFNADPLILPRGVTLFVGRAATLYASNDPRAYDIRPGSCGSPPKDKEATCKPFLFAYQAAFSGVAGEGTIDGSGVAPELVSSYESQGFSLSGVNLRNTAGIAAAIFKTTGFSCDRLRIDANTGILLSNAVEAKVSNTWIRAEKDSVALQSSILGPTTNVTIREVVFFGGRGIVKGTGDAGNLRNIATEGLSAENPADPKFADAPKPAYALDLTTVAKPGIRTSLVVEPGESIQKAIDALPVSGGEITVKPGTYREVVTIRKPNVHLHGQDPDPSKTTIVFNNGPANGGTFASGTVYVEAPNVTIDHLTIANDLGYGKGQAVALAVTADRAIFRNLRILGAQDTLLAASRYCYGDYGPCEPARQYFADSYIEGNTDFIFGDSLAVFEGCHLHGIAPGTVMYTAHSRHTAEQTESAYVFDHCRLTADQRTQGSVSLGRSWRPYATVVFLHAQIDAPVIPAGWTEWMRFGKSTLPTAFYAEFDSAGPGANPQAREPYSHQLTAADAEKWAPRLILAGKDNWNPTAAQ
jgi:pectin methylesterase-like acyl-CoA thioesterase